MSDSIYELLQLQKKLMETIDEKECHQLIEKIYHANKNYFLSFVYKIGYGIFEDGNYFQETIGEYIDQYGLDFPEYINQDNGEREYDKISTAIEMSEYARKINIFKRKGNWFAEQLDKQIEKEIHLELGNKLTLSQIYNYKGDYLSRKSQLSLLINQPFIMNELDTKVKIRLNHYEYLYRLFVTYDDETTDENYQNLVIFWNNHSVIWNTELESIKNNQIENNEDKEHINKMKMIQQAIGDILNLIFKVEPKKYIQFITQMPHFFEFFKWMEHSFERFLTQEQIDMLSAIQTNRDSVIQLLFNITYNDIPDSYDNQSLNFYPLYMKRVINWIKSVNIEGLFDENNEKYKTGLSDFYIQFYNEKKEDNLNKKVGYILSKQFAHEKLVKDLPNNDIELEIKKI